MRRIPQPLAHWLCFCALCFSALCLPWPAAAETAAKPLRGQWALLIGINEYQDKNIRPLHGPVNDVAAMQEVLIKRWGFPAAQVKTLVNAQATRAAILQGLQDLQKHSAPGDDLLIYFSGHGSSAHDLENRIPVPLDTGLLAPWDYPLASRDVGKIIVGRSDLRPLLLQMEARGHKVWVITDACNTGEVVRAPGDAQNLLIERYLSINHDLRPRRLGELQGQAAKKRQTEANSAGQASISPWPYRQLTLLAASSAGQAAVDIPQGVLPTIDGKAHGALTDALLRILHGQVAADFNGDGILSLEEAQRAAVEFMSLRPYDHVAQRLPNSAEDSFAVGHAPLLRARGVAGKPAKVDPAPLSLALERKLAKLPALQRALQGIAHLQLRHGDDKSADLRLIENGADWVLESGLRQRLVTFDSEQAATPERIRTVLRQHAFIHHLSAVARRYRRESLPVELQPVGNSGVLRIGQQIWYTMRPRSKAVIVLLDVDADGKLTVGYPDYCPPTGVGENGSLIRIPFSAGIHFKVSPPTGLNSQFHFAFDDAPPALSKLCGLGNTTLGLDDERITLFVQSLQKQEGKFAFAQTWMRVEEGK
ncbi:caspase family protein [Massilia sp. W12]|uniref:caspase family protein n=1 Tax=Massilia sp. W12 TaxID=3126507 RepID=UPI0030CD348E